MMLLIGCLVAAALLAGLLVWDNARMFERVARYGRWEARRRRVMWERGQRAVEDRAWTLRKVEYQAAIRHTFLRADIRTADELLDRLEDVSAGAHSVRVPARLEVVR